MRNQDSPGDTPDTDDASDGLETTRRGALAALGLGGLAALGSSPAAGDVGGGPASDELAHLARPVYEGAESELPDAGVEGRRFTVTDSGGTYPQWTELRDTGSAWEPISLGTGSLSTDDLASNSLSCSYNVYTDGADIWAIPQKNPFDSVTLEEVTGTDIGVVLDKLMYDELPPQGTKTRGRGRINLKAGGYPGILSNGQVDGLRPPGQCVVAGEVSSHHDPNSSPDTIPTTNPPVQLNTDSVGLAQLNVDGEFLIGARVQDIEIIGPGNGANGSIGVDMTGSNPFDWAHFERLHLQKFDKISQNNSPGTGQVFFQGCQFRDFGGSGNIEGERINIENSVFVIKDGANIFFTDAQLINSELHCVGEAKASAFVGGDSSLHNVRIAKFGTTNTSGTAVKVASGNVNLNGITVDRESSSGGFTNVFNVTGGGGHSFRAVKEHDSTSSWLVTVNGGDDVFVGTDIDASMVRDIGGSRPYWGDTLFGGPFGGTDIGSLTGATQGDYARSDGTNGSASADELFILKANGDWQSLADPTTTISPA